MGERTEITAPTDQPMTANEVAAAIYMLVVFSLFEARIGSRVKAECVGIVGITGEIQPAIIVREATEQEKRRQHDFTALLLPDQDPFDPGWFSYVVETD